MAPKKEIAVLLRRLHDLEHTPSTPGNASVLQIGIEAIRERLSFLSRLRGARF